MYKDTYSVVIADSGGDIVYSDGSGNWDAVKTADPTDTATGSNYPAFNYAIGKIGDGATELLMIIPQRMVITIFAS